MLRGHKDIAARVLEEIMTAPNHAPSRVMGKAGTNSSFLKTLVNHNLIKLEKIGKKRTHVSITEKGRTFLQHYRICNELLPS
jgi:predicted transcriptional regulator